MKAAVCNEYGKPLDIEEVTLEPPRDNEVRVRIAACAICHSDIHSIKGEHAIGKLPALPGHEAAGYVEEIGKDVTYVKPGDRGGLQPDSSRMRPLLLLHHGQTPVLRKLAF